jgi:hypothetical protein
MVIRLEAGITSFLDEGTINGMSYIYKVHAIDHFNNVSNPSNEETIGTITIGTPYPPISVSANAFNDYILISIVPPGYAQTDIDIYTPVEYKIRMSKNGGTTWADVAITENTSYDYYFNRQVDGYPEINTLTNWRFLVYSINCYGNLSATGVSCSVSTGDYKTWAPVPITGLYAEATGRTLYLHWDKQAVYGTLCYRVQISKDNVNWYKPNLVDDPYASENNWKTGNAGGFYETDINANGFTQVVPLKGQNTNLGNNRYIIEPVDYYYRVCSVNTTTGVVLDWSNSVKITAAGTNPQDILKNSIGWDQIIDQSIKVSKLGVDRLIAGEATLAFIANDTNTRDKNRTGFQYWALQRYVDEWGTEYKKGEFRINSDNAVDPDYIIVDPTNGISLKSSKLVMESVGSVLYGNFKIVDVKTIGQRTFFQVDLVNDSGNTLASPKITIGYNGTDDSSNYTGSTQVDIKGTMYVDTPDYPF